MGRYEDEPLRGTASTENRHSIELLEERAAALDSEADAIKRQAVALADQEAQLNSTIEQHKAALDLLLARLETLQSERKSLFNRAETIREEAAELRDQAFDCEAEIALSRLEDQHAQPPQPPPVRVRTTGELDPPEPSQPGPVPESTNAHSSSRAY